jgi:hypothetical protein
MMAQTVDPFRERSRGIQGTHILPVNLDVKIHDVGDLGRLLTFGTSEAGQEREQNRGSHPENVSRRDRRKEGV